MVTSTMQSVAGEKAPRRRRSPRSRCRLSWTGVVLGVVLGVAPLRVLAAAGGAAVGVFLLLLVLALAGAAMAGVVPLAEALRGKIMGSVPTELGVV